MLLSTKTGALFPTQDFLILLHLINEILTHSVFCGGAENKTEDSSFPNRLYPSPPRPNLSIQPQNEPSGPLPGNFEMIL